MSRRRGAEYVADAGRPARTPLPLRARRRARAAAGAGPALRPPAAPPVGGLDGRQRKRAGARARPRPARSGSRRAWPTARAGSSTTCSSTSWPTSRSSPTTRPRSTRWSTGTRWPSGPAGSSSPRATATTRARPAVTDDDEAPATTATSSGPSPPDNTGPIEDDGWFRTDDTDAAPRRPHRQVQSSRARSSTEPPGRLIRPRRRPGLLGSPTARPGHLGLAQRGDRRSVVAVLLEDPPPAGCGPRGGRAGR